MLNLLTLRFEPSFQLLVAPILNNHQKEGSKKHAKTLPSLFSPVLTRFKKKTRTPFFFDLFSHAFTAWIVHQKHTSHRSLGQPNISVQGDRTMLAHLDVNEVREKTWRAVGAVPLSRKKKPVKFIGKLTVPWKLRLFHRKYIFKWLVFSLVMLVSGGVCVRQKVLLRILTQFYQAKSSATQSDLILTIDFKNTF